MRNYFNKLKTVTSKGTRNSGEGGIGERYELNQSYPHFTSSARKSGDEFLFRLKGSFIDETLQLSHKKKSIYDRSGDHDGPAIKPLRIIYRSGKFTSLCVAPLAHNGLVLRRAGTTYTTGWVQTLLRTGFAVPLAET